jgi:hypothetical protein
LAREIYAGTISLAEALGNRRSEAQQKAGETAEIAPTNQYPIPPVRMAFNGFEVFGRLREGTSYELVMAWDESEAR